MAQLICVIETSESFQYITTRYIPWSKLFIFLLFSAVHYLQIDWIKNVIKRLWCERGGWREQSTMWTSGSIYTHSIEVIVLTECRMDKNLLLSQYQAKAPWFLNKKWRCIGALNKKCDWNVFHKSMYLSF